MTAPETTLHRSIILCPIILYAICIVRYPGVNCTNKAWPDIHHHYREARFTQVSQTTVVQHLLYTPLIHPRLNTTGGGKQTIFSTPWK